MKNIYFWLLLSLLAIPFRLWSQCIDTDDAAQNHSGTIKTLLGSTIYSFDWRQVQIFAYPNPATDYITVGCVNNQFKEVHIFIILDATYSYFGDFKLKLPFYQGETWKGFSDVDSMNVISFSTDYNVLGKKYDIYYLKRTVPGAAYSVVQSLQLSKNIGLVSQNINIFWGRLTQRQSFQLIDYQLK